MNFSSQYKNIFEQKGNEKKPIIKWDIIWINFKILERKLDEMYHQSWLSG